MHTLSNIQFNSKTLIIPQGAILLWSWRARKQKPTKTKQKQTNKQKHTHKFKRTIQQTQHHQQRVLL